MTEYKKKKSALPETTVYNIRSILNELGISLKETSYENDGLFGCRLKINNSGLSNFDIDSCGHGRSYECALASGYGEFMERLQNGVIYNKAFLYYISQKAKRHIQKSPLEQTMIDGELNMTFLYDPKEQQMNAEEIILKYRDDLSNLFRLDKKVVDYQLKIKEIIKDEKVIMVPTYSYREEKEILYPVSWALLATGSNGMCAGNTPSEALLHGICEIFERYACAQIFLQQLTPPTIPIEQFAGSVVYDKMQHLIKKNNYIFIVKDCSLGKGLPVLGLIIINRKNHTYNFKLGSDFVPEIALERCLTEVYQSNTGFRGLSYLNVSQMEEKDRYYLMLKDGSGQWPSSIFYATPSYNYKGFNRSLGNNDSEDLKYAAELICKLGSNLYIRDNSFLGFPSYYVIAPGLSWVYRNFDDLRDAIEADPTSIISEFNMKLDINSDIETFTDKLEFSLKTNNHFCFNDLIPFYNSKKLQALSPYLFLCMAYYYMENYQAAYENIVKFLKGKGEEYEYYYAVSEYILHRFLKKTDNTDIINMLTTKYGHMITTEVINDMYSNKKVFRYYDFEKYFDWDNMNTNEESSIIDILRIEKKIQKKKIENPICQDKLKQLFT